MQNQICFITGATDGVGKATAIELARLGFTVVMVARNKAKAEAVRAEIMASTGNSNVDYLIADLCSLTQIREVAKSFKRRYPWLDVLINNAGIFLSVRKTTEDGYEMNFQVNYLSHFLLTTLLLDELKKSGQGRVVNLASSVYRLGEFDPYNLQSERKFSTMGTYSSSKLFDPVTSLAPSCSVPELCRRESKRGYRHAIDEFIQWYCSEPRLSFNKVVVTRYRIFLENRQLAAGTINCRLAAVRRLAYEAADAGLLSPELAAGPACERRQEAGCEAWKLAYG